MSSEIVLASKSPRRAELLESAGVKFTVKVAGIDEVNSETGVQTVLDLSRQKADAIESEKIVLAADTVVCTVDGEILGKPQDDTQAREYLKMLSGDIHYVHTGYCVKGKSIINEVVTTEVVMRTIDDSEIDWYISTGEAFDKAGGYGIQGQAAGFITAINGSYTSVVGLPLAQVLQALKDVN